MYVCMYECARKRACGGGGGLALSPLLGPLVVLAGVILPIGPYARICTVCVALLCVGADT